MGKNKKTVKKYLYDGLGFDVMIINAPMVKIFGEWVLEIDLNALQRTVLTHLAWKPEPLTGSEIAFIRKYFQLSISAFAKILGLTHPAIIKWEKKKDNPTQMSPSNEKYVRLFILTKLSAKKKDYIKMFEEIEISTQSPSEKRPLVLDAMGA